MRHVQVPSGSNVRRARVLGGLCACIISCCLPSCGRREPCRLLSPAIVFDPDSGRWGHLVLRDATTSEAAGAVLASGRVGSAYGTHALLVCFGQFSWVRQTGQFGLDLDPGSSESPEHATSRGGLGGFEPPYPRGYVVVVLGPPLQVLGPLSHDEAAAEVGALGADFEQVRSLMKSPESFPVTSDP